jgi:hypothetical protein
MVSQAASAKHSRLISTYIIPSYPYTLFFTHYKATIFAKIIFSLDVVFSVDWHYSFTLMPPIGGIL